MARGKHRLRRRDRPGSRDLRRSREPELHKYSDAISLTGGSPFPTSTAAANAATNPINDPSQLFVYAQLLQSDQIRRQIRAPINAIAANVVTTGAFSTGNALPFLAITATAPSSTGAQALAARAAAGIQRYVSVGQVAAQTPAAARVSLTLVNAPLPGKPVTTRTRVVVLPGIVFITVLIATLGLLLVLENLARPDETAKSSQQAGDASVSTTPWLRDESVPEAPQALGSGKAGGGLLRRQS